MRIRTAFLGFSMIGVAASFGLEACGGDTSGSSSPADAGGDVVDAAKDTGADAAFDAAKCDTSHDFLKDIPDASVADGATTTGLCAGCLAKNCKKEITACQVDCSCQAVANQALSCYAQSGGDIFATAGCIGSVPASTKTLFALFGCAQSACPQECATSLADAGDGGDGG